MLLAAVHAVAQQPAARHFTDDDGLPDNEIYYLYQDKKGIIWISTNSGLCRYNGQSFQYYSSPKLMAKSTGCIQEDRFGRIWANNFSGQIFYVEGDSLVITPLRNINSNSPFAFGPQNQLAVSSSADELVIYTPRHTQKNEPPVYIQDNVIKGALQNPFFSADGRLWATVSAASNTGRGITAAYDGKQLQFFNFQQPRRHANRTSGFTFEWNGHICYFEREKSSLFRQSGTVFTEVVKPDLPGLKMVQPLHNGGLALCTNNGLYISKGIETDFAVVARHFTGQTISAFCEDDKGNLWAGTLTDGIYFIPNPGLTRVVPAKTGLNYDHVTAICPGPAGKLLLGFLNGELGLLDQHFNYQTLQPPNKLSNKVHSLFYDSRLELINWHADKIYQSRLGASGARLHPYRGVGYATKDMVYIPGWKAAIQANPVDIQVISLDEQPISKKIPPGWIKRYETDTFFDNTMTHPQQPLLLSRERGRAVYHDSIAGTFWGADKNGITVYRENSQSEIRLNGEPVYATSFCAHRDMVWAGSFSQGLIAIRDERVVKQFLPKDGLASNTVYKITASGNHLWIVTDKGIQYFDIDRTIFYLIDKSTGLPSLKINNTALVNGLYYISTPKGLFSLPDDVMFTQHQNTMARLQSVYCNGMAIAAGAANFKPDENDFVFKVETPVYNSRALLRYRYRLKGAGRDFNITTLDNAVFEYKSLQPGRYQFELYLTDADSRTIGEPVLYSFVIRPPFYKTAWFAGLCILLLAGMVYLLLRRRIGQIKKREDEKLRLAQLETELKQSQLTGIKAQMNPHFMFNALNSIQEFILLNDKRQANMYMGKFADLMRMTLDMSNKTEVLLDDEIKMLRLYLELEALRFETDFTHSVVIDEAAETGHIHLPAMLIQPNIENAVKHGLLHKTGKKILDVQFSMNSPHTLCCTITDNGIGRKRSGEINEQRLKKHTSFSTGATQKRLELLNFQKKEPITLTYEDLHDAHGNAAGTRVTLVIPVNP